MEDNHKALFIQHLKQENENNAFFNNECNDINIYKETKYIQEKFNEELYDETRDTRKTENDPLAFSDDDIKRMTNNEVNEMYIKGEPVLEQCITDKDEIINNEYEYCDMEDTKQNIDIKEGIIECSVKNTSLNEDFSQSPGKKNDVRDTTSISDCGKVRICKEKSNKLCPVKHFTTDVQTGKNETKIFECLCNERSYAETERHIDNAQKKLKNHECQMCNKSFTKSAYLKAHISSIHEGIKYKCEDCKKSYPVLKTLERHIITVHLKLRKKCQICKKTFSESGSLKRHISNIHKSIKYNCEYCKNSYTEMGNLKRHISTVHEKLRNHKCHICMKMFSGSGNLKVHIRSKHERIKYKCEECKRNYTEIAYLKKHINTVHKKLKNHKCHICEKMFSQSSALQLHMRSIHKGIKYKCKECDKCYTQTGYLKIHVNTVHKETNCE